MKQIDSPAVEQRVEPIRTGWSAIQSKYLEYKASQGNASKTVARYKAALNAFARHLKKSGIIFADEIKLTTLEAYTTYRTKAEKMDVEDCIYRRTGH